MKEYKVWLGFLVIALSFVIFGLIKYNIYMEEINNQSEKYEVKLEIGKKNKSINSISIKDNNSINIKDNKTIGRLINSYGDVNKDTLSVSGHDYPVDYIITLDKSDVIFTNHFLELPNEKDSLGQELLCFEYFDFAFGENRKTCTSGKYNIEKTNQNL